MANRNSRMVRGLASNSRSHSNSKRIKVETPITYKKRIRVTVDKKCGLEYELLRTKIVHSKEAHKIKNDNFIQGV